MMSYSANEIQRMSAGHMPVRLAIASQLLAAFLVRGGTQAITVSEVDVALEGADLLIQRHVETQPEG
jgi:hypothetical protein